MKSFCVFSIIPALLLFTACCGMSSRENIQTGESAKQEYLVQFEQGTGKDRIETVLNEYAISDFSYITSSRERGYVVLIKISETERDIIGPLGREKIVKNIDQNYKRKIYRK
ncbi:MAG: hypothetical protein K9J85_03300 [Desulfobacteraceae bacterium]|nr:hypothetical protein [Desulfobacteraceae bacterium]